MSKEMKKLVPTYRMETKDFYVLLKLVMGITKQTNINGMRKQFFDEVTEKDYNKSLKRLEKGKIIALVNGDIQISQAVKSQIDTMLASGVCLAAQNNELKKNGRLLTFYYANGIFVGVMSDDKKTVIAKSDEIAGVMHPFEKILLASGLSDGFDLGKWGEIAKEKFVDPIEKPTKSCILALGSNRNMCDTYSVTMIGDKKRLQILRGDTETTVETAICETVSADKYYGVIYKELKHLQEECGRSKNTKDGKNHKGSLGNRQIKEKTDYEKIVETAGFPRSLIGFIFYTIINTIKALPGMVVNLVKKKTVRLVMYALWAAAIFFYNMYATCYINDTFWFDRGVAWGNITPYLMAGQISTPSSVYGFNLDWGIFNTAFLVAPLMLVITYILQHMYKHVKSRKLAFIPEVLISFPGIMAKQIAGDFNKKKIWITYIIVCVVSFIIMNPFTVFLLGALLLMIYAHGKSNSVVRFFMLASCATNRKKVEAGKKEQPDTKNVAETIGIMGSGFTIYSIVNLIVWHLCNYNFYVRLIATILLIVFCIMQMVMSNKKRLQAPQAMFFLGLFVFVVLAHAGIVLADDGGITESGGTLMGLIHNAGFATILGISIATIGFVIGGAALIPLVAAGAAIGLGTFIVGQTDTKAGDYVSKSADQFFDGVEDGDQMTALCAATIGLDMISSLMSIKGVASTVTNAGTLAYYGMSLAKDVVSTAGDIEALYDDSVKMMNNEESIAKVAIDVVALAFDAYGLYGDYGDITQTLDNIASDGMDAVTEAATKTTLSDITSKKDDAISGATAEYNASYDAAKATHDSTVSQIELDFNNSYSDEIASSKFSQELSAETDNYSDIMDSIRNTENTTVDAAISTYKVEKFEYKVDKIDTSYTGIGYVKDIKTVGEDFVYPNVTGSVIEPDATDVVEDTELELDTDEE